MDDAIKEIVNRRLRQVPPSLTEILPPIIFNGEPYSYLLGTHFILNFADEEAFERINRFIARGFHPFPCFIVDENMIPSPPTLFKLENSRNVMLENIAVAQAHSVLLGKDSTLVVNNHKQICHIDSEVFDYVIDLAYIISFGYEIDGFNYFHFLDDLIAYSMKQWKSRYGR